jgi:hypothetical protein
MKLFIMLTWDRIFPEGNFILEGSNWWCVGKFLTGTAKCSIRNADY